MSIDANHEIMTLSLMIKVLELIRKLFFGEQMIMRFGG